MKTTVKLCQTILFAALLTSAVSSCSQQTLLSPDHHRTGYVPWGIDEFEFFGLTEEEIERKFKGTLHLNHEYSMAAFDDGAYGQFHLTFDNQKKVDSVQRIVTDGAGCKIKGPLLDSKKAALRFSVDGLIKASPLNKEEQEKLATAKKLLEDSSESPLVH